MIVRTCHRCNKSVQQDDIMCGHCGSWLKKEKKKNTNQQKQRTQQAQREKERKQQAQREKERKQLAQRERERKQKKVQGKGKVMEWEYASVQFGWLVDWKDDSNSITKFLNRWGKNGWELVGQKEVTRQEFSLGTKPLHKYKGAWVKKTVEVSSYTTECYGEKVFWMFFFKRAKR